MSPMIVTLLHEVISTCTCFCAVQIHYILCNHRSLSIQLTVQIDGRAKEIVVADCSQSWCQTAVSWVRHQGNFHLMWSDFIHNESALTLPDQECIHSGTTIFYSKVALYVRKIYVPKPMMQLHDATHTNYIFYLLCFPNTIRSIQNYVIG